MKKVSDELLLFMCYQAGFNESALGGVQLLFVKPRVSCAYVGRAGEKISVVA